MKKMFLILSAIVLFTITPANAEKIQATALADFDVDNPPKTFTIQLNQPINLDDGKVIPQGSIITNTIYKAKQSKRLKMKAAMVVKVSQIIEPDGYKYKIDNLYAKYTKLTDKVETSKEAAVSVANHFVKNITLPYHAVEGAIKNEEGSRVKSAFKGAYDASPLSYMGKGETIQINKGDTIYFEFGYYEPENANIVKKLKYN